MNIFEFILPNEITFTTVNHPQLKQDRLSVQDKDYLAGDCELLK